MLAGTMCELKPGMVVMLKALTTRSVVVGQVDHIDETSVVLWDGLERLRLAKSWVWDVEVLEDDLSYYCQDK